MSTQLNQILREKPAELVAKGEELIDLLAAIKAAGGHVHSMTRIRSCNAMTRLKISWPTSDEPPGVHGDSGAGSAQKILEDS
jgi:hypothetical protein